MLTGTLVMTNYQLFFEPTAVHSRASTASLSTKDAARQHGFDANTTHCPLASIERIEQVGQEKYVFASMSFLVSFCT